MPSPAHSGSLLVKLGAIGDSLMLLPAAKALLEAGSDGTEPASRVDWICGTTTAPLLGLYPWLRPLAIDEKTFLHGSVTDRVRSLQTLWRRLARTRYDLVATVYYDRRYRLLTLPTRARRRVHLSHADRAFRLLPGRHHTDEFARVLLGWPDEVRPASLAPVPPPVLPPTPAPRSPAHPRVVLVPGGARNLLRDDALRRWPLSSYVTVAQSLLDRGYEVVLAGSSEDRWVLPPFAGLPVTDLLGSLSLVETLGLFGDADLVLTHDTGPMHLAGLTTTPLLALFGPTDPHGRLPRRPGTLALWGGEHFACRPCYDSQTYAACQHNACIEQISPAICLEAVEFLLANPTISPLIAPPSMVPGLSGRRQPELSPGIPMLQEGHHVQPVRTEPSAPAPAPEGRSRDEPLRELPPALFLDRDGVINEEVGYLIDPADLRFLPGLFPMLRTAQRLGYRLVVVTNQSGIARGLYTVADFQRLMAHIEDELRKEGVSLTATYFCPFHPTHGLGEWKREHEDRKPGAGMLLRAARDLGLDLRRSIMVGDRCSDISAANTAGLRQAFLLRGTEQTGCEGRYREIASLAELERWLEDDRESLAGNDSRREI